MSLRVRCERKALGLCDGDDCEHARVHEAMWEMPPDGRLTCLDPTWCPLAQQFVRCVNHAPVKHGDLVQK